MKQIERDLAKNSLDRLLQWIDDTKMRFDAANLPEGTALAAAYCSLVQTIAIISHELTIDENQLLSILRTCYREVEKTSRKPKKAVDMSS